MPRGTAKAVPYVRRPPRARFSLRSSAQYVEPGYLVFASEGPLVGQRFDLARAADIWQFKLDGSAPPAAIALTPFDELVVRFSPDGRFFSFQSNASGRVEVYVAPFPPTGEQVRVSTGGGRQPRWSGDGREMLYLSADGRMMAVPVRTTPALSVGTPVPLFELKRPWVGFDRSSTGRLLAIVRETNAAEQPLTAVLHWTAELAAR